MVENAFRLCREFDGVVKFDAGLRNRDYTTTVIFREVTAVHVTMAPSALQVRPCPVRCFFCDLSSSIFQGNNVFRLMGVIVSIRHEQKTPFSSISSRAQHADLNQRLSRYCIQLDDGTALVNTVVPHHIVQRINLSVGMTIECIVTLDPRSSDLETDQVCIVTDVHAEALRWLELSYRLKAPPDTLKWGYPILPISAEDIFDIISSEADQGVSLQDIAHVMDLDENYVANLVQDLQLSGQVYRNQQGKYLPL